MAIFEADTGFAGVVVLDGHHWSWREDHHWA